MTINFFEPGDVPQPPKNIRIELLKATPYPDGWRVKIEVHVTPFQQRPNLELDLVRVMGDESHKIVASFSIVETMHPRMEFTMHVRGVDAPDGDYQLKAMVYYREQLDAESTEPPPIQIIDTRELDLVITAEE